MRPAGHRHRLPINFSGLATSLAEGARFNDGLDRLPGSGNGFIPKAAYRFQTRAEANRHRMDCRARSMASIAHDNDIADQNIPERALAGLGARPEKP